jgi:predicted deacetylase
LHCNSVEVNTELMPVDLKHKGSIGVLRVHLDMVPYLNKNEILLEDLVEKQMGLEKKFESEGMKFVKFCSPLEIP